jgi:CBS domain-containing protein
MQVSEILTQDVETIAPDATIQEAAQRLRSLDVGSMPICDGRRLLGMITDRDITIRVVAEGRDPSQTRVQEAMTPGVCWCFEDEDVRKAAQIMEEKQIRRLPILRRSDKGLVGIVALGDIARLGRDRMSGEALEQISQPGEYGEPHPGQEGAMH